MSCDKRVRNPLLFGSPIVTGIARYSYLTDTGLIIPGIVARCFHEINTDLKAEGLFRRSGAASVLNQLQDQFEQCDNPFDVVVPAVTTVHCWTGQSLFLEAHGTGKYNEDLFLRALDLIQIAFHTGTSSSFNLSTSVHIYNRGSKKLQPNDCIYYGHYSSSDIYPNGCSLPANATISSLPQTHAYTLVAEDSPSPVQLFIAQALRYQSITVFTFYPLCAVPSLSASTYPPTRAGETKCTVDWDRGVFDSSFAFVIRTTKGETSGNGNLQPKSLSVKEVFFFFFF
ncbi:hypothetical protein BC941DRAFT_443609, partial [Chlamydoabsidia padenii]